MRGLSRASLSPKGTASGFWPLAERDGIKICAAAVSLFQKMVMAYRSSMFTVFHRHIDVSLHAARWQIAEQVPQYPRAQCRCLCARCTLMLSFAFACKSWRGMLMQAACSAWASPRETPLGGAEDLSKVLGCTGDR